MVISRERTEQGKMDIADIINEIDKDALIKVPLKLNIGVVSNFCQEPFFSKCLCLKFLEEKVKAKIHYYNDMDLVYEDKCKELFHSDLVILFINYEMKYDRGINTSKEMQDEALRDSIALISLLQRKISAHLFVISYEDFYNLTFQVSGHRIQNDGMDYVNQKIKQELLAETVMIDLKRVIAINGVNASYDYKNFRRWGNPYSCTMYQTLSEEIVRQYSRFMSTKIKCLVLDCDNVLWLGNVSDCGSGGIELGETYTGHVYQKFQKYVLELFKRGMILTLCSKNENDDVVSVFERNPNMILKLEHISTYRINWKSKAENILSIAKEIGIAPENMLFIDDSVDEIECVRQSIPKINIMQFQADSVFKDISIPYFDEREDLKESLIRTETYKKNKVRHALMEAKTTVEDYLLSIHNLVRIHRAEETELKRISELSLRTNRMSSQKRYDAITLKQMYNREDYQLFSVYVSDKFGDLGLVGCMGIDESLHRLDLFCLSCRALGRHVEYDMIEFVNNNYTIDSFYFYKDTKNLSLYDIFVKSFKEANVSV